jgi:hypothetical protein
MSTIIECDVHFQRHDRGIRKGLHLGKTEACSPRVCVPRVSRWMALALRLDSMLLARTVVSNAELAKLGHVSRARISQIMNLLNLAPAIQEELLFLERPVRGRDTIHLWQLQPLAALHDWGKQLRRWRALRVRPELAGQ